MRLIILVEQPRSYGEYDKSDDRVAAFKSIRVRGGWGIADGDEFSDLLSHIEIVPSQSSRTPVLLRDASDTADSGFDCMSAFDAYNSLLGCLQGLTSRMYLRFGYPDPRDPKVPAISGK